ncbi:MAG: hypothetical protein WAK55_03040 [Xanthobacteraceae bacterium]
MRTTGSELPNESLEMDIERNVHELSRAGVTFRQSDNGEDEMSATGVDTLLDRVSESSRREVEKLIDQLQTFHNKLQADRSRIHRDIVEYTGLSQQVMQVTAIISDSVKSLPGAPGISG